MAVLLMAVISFRHDRNPELTVTKKDVDSGRAIGTAILSDRHGVQPRWVWCSQVLSGTRVRRWTKPLRPGDVDTGEPGEDKPF